MRVRVCVCVFVRMCVCVCVKNNGKVSGEGYYITDWYSGSCVAVVTIVEVPAVAVQAASSHYLRFNAFMEN